MGKNWFACLTFFLVEATFFFSNIDMGTWKHYWFAWACIDAIYHSVGHVWLYQILLLSHSILCRRRRRQISGPLQLSSLVVFVVYIAYDIRRPCEYIVHNLLCRRFRRWGEWGEWNWCRISMKRTTTPLNVKTMEQIYVQAHTI